MSRAVAHRARCAAVPAQPFFLEGDMNRTSWLDEVQRNLSDLIARSPAADLQRNAKAMMTDAFSRMDLVTREEFDVQVELLARTRVKLDALEAQLRRLEGQGSAPPAAATPSVDAAAAMGAFIQPGASPAGTTPSAGAPADDSPTPSITRPTVVSSSTGAPAAGTPAGNTPAGGNIGPAPVSPPSSTSSAGATPAANPPKEGDLGM